MVFLMPNLNEFSCKKSLKSLGLVAALALGVMLPYHHANAATVGPGCDSAFMESMQKKGWMEAQREIMIAQTVIAKPDSVFALGCFGNFTGGYSASFVQGTAYPYASRVTTFVNAAFPHAYGGGHYSSVGGSNDGNNSTCNIISKLWDAARKENLTQPSPMLGTLQDIATYDRGAFPTTAGAPSAYGSSGSAGTPLGIFYGAHAANKSVNADFDDMDLFAKMTLPQSQLASQTPALPSTCAKGIPTGIKINIGGTDRPEIICPNPGCVSDGEATPKCCDYSGGNCQ